MRCANCGGESFREVEQEISRKIVIRGKADTFTASASAWQCKKCREVIVDGSVLARFELAVGRELANRGVLSGDAFRFMRKALGLRAVDLAELLDVRAETISRWETGSETINHAAFATLGSLVQDELEGRKTTHDRLSALRKAPKLPKTIRLKLAPG